METEIKILQAQKLLAKWLRQKRLTAWIEISFFAMAFSVFTWALANIFLLWNTQEQWSVGPTLFVLFMIIGAYSKGVFKFNKTHLARFLDRNYPELEESVSLLLKEDRELSVLAKWQQIKVSRKLLEQKSKIRIPHRLYRSGILTGVLLIGAYFLVPLKGRLHSSEKLTHISNEKQCLQAPIAPKEEVVLETAELRLLPPAYTRKPASKQQQMDIQAIQYSQGNWQLTFSGAIQKAYLIFNEKDTLDFQKKDGNYVARKQLVYPEFYRIVWQSAGEKMQTSELFAVKITEDQPPQVSLPETELYQKLKWGQADRLDVNVELRDDFGISDAYILATVSRGSGESVKFREVRLPFQQDFKSQKSFYKLSEKLLFDELKMEAGDELYYRVMAFDNKQPQKQMSRSDTYILVLEDTAKQEFSVAQGVAVDIMPEYFRSQRQIIIDTEKLMKEKSGTREFKQRSNELAADQKILRLRYGQFLGEEYESAIGSGTEMLTEMLKKEDDEHEEHEDNEHHEGEDHEQVEAQMPEHDHAGHEEHSGEEEIQFGVGGKLLEAAYHKHDPDGVSTYFDEEIKATLKAALAKMWEAELYLRLMEPAKALPYEYEALELIKKVQQKSRIYVERLGFEPPPLKPAEKRLTGELHEINSQQDIRKNTVKAEFPHMRIGVKVLQELKEGGLLVTNRQKEQLQLAGNELSAIALERAGQYLKALELLRVLLQDDFQDGQRMRAVQAIQAAFLNALPEQPQQAQQQRASTGKLHEIYMEELSKQ
jgi:hypothetical protein